MIVSPPCSGGIWRPDVAGPVVTVEPGKEDVAEGSMPEESDRMERGMLEVWRRRIGVW